MSLIPIFAVIIGSITAGIVYIWQKAEDRKERFRSEKQLAFTNYLKSLREVTNSIIIATIDNTKAGELNLIAHQHDHFTDTFELYASLDIRASALLVEDSLLKWKKKILSTETHTENASDYLMSRQILVSAMKLDLFSSIETSFGTRLSKKLLDCLASSKSTLVADKGKQK